MHLKMCDKCGHYLACCRSDQPPDTPLSPLLPLLARPHCRAPGLGLSGSLSSGDPQQPGHFLEAGPPPGTAPSHQQLGLRGPHPDCQDTGSGPLYSQEDGGERYTTSVNSDHQNNIIYMYIFVVCIISLF